MLKALKDFILGNDNDDDEVSSQRNTNSNTISENDFRKAQAGIQKTGNISFLLTLPANTLRARVATGEFEGKSYLWLIANHVAKTADRTPFIYILNKFENQLSENDLDVTMLDQSMLTMLQEIAGDYSDINIANAFLLRRDINKDDDSCDSAGTLIEEGDNANLSDDSCHSAATLADDDLSNNSNAETTANSTNLRAWKLRQLQLQQSTSSTPAPVQSGINSLLKVPARKP
jgi:hypothetical protein